MSLSCANATRVEEMPIGERHTVHGVSGGAVPTHCVHREVPEEIRLPGVNPECRTEWSIDVAHDVVSTDTLGELGLDVFTVAAEGGQMHLSPSGLDPRGQRTRMRCIRVGGMQAMPTGAAATSGVTALGTRRAPSVPPPHIGVQMAPKRDPHYTPSGLSVGRAVQLLAQAFPRAR